LIDRSPDITRVICVGAAGSLSNSVELGDVVVGTCSVEHDYKLRFVQAPSPVHFADPSLLASVQDALANSGTPFGVHFGPIASGDEDVVERTRAEELRAETGALCVAWEGSGAARAAAFNGLGFIEMRVITDAADHAAKRSFDENLHLVMRNLAVVLTRCSEGRAFTTHR
jgi:adenosylhomocysteine nucleosidase